MSGFLPLGAMLGGVALGWLANVISNELAFRRRLMPAPCLNLRDRVGWWRFGLHPWKPNDCPSAWRARNMVVVLVYAGLVLWLAKRPDALKLPPVLTALVLLYLGVVTVLDLEHKVVLLPTVWIGLVLGLVVGSTLHGLPMTLVGGLAGFAMMYFFYVFGAWFMAWLARRGGDTLNEVALGFGDVNLAAVMGLALGWPGVLAGLYFAVFAGGVGGLAYVAIRSVRGGYSRYSAIPYGPFLTLAMAWFLILRPLFYGG